MSGHRRVIWIQSLGPGYLQVQAIDGGSSVSQAVRTALVVDGVTVGQTLLRELTGEGGEAELVMAQGHWAQYREELAA